MTTGYNLYLPAQQAHLSRHFQNSLGVTPSGKDPFNPLHLMDQV